MAAFIDAAEFTVQRDCPAVMVPWGSPATLQTGRSGYVTQQLGGTFTVLVDGNLYRVEGKEAEALGLELPTLDETPADAGPPTRESIETAAWRALSSCYDPELPHDIVSLGLVYGCEVVPVAEGFQVEVKMTLTAPGCGMGTLIADEAQAKLQAIPGVTAAHVELVWDPPWGRDSMSEAVRLEMGLL